MHETGKVISVSGARAQVEMAAREACESCSAHGMCNWTGTTVRRILAVNRAGAGAGDVVELDIQPRSGLSSNLIVFGIPALGMLAGVLFGGLVFSDMWAGILGGAGLVLGVVVVKLIDISVNRSGRSLPVIVRRLSPEETKGDKRDQVAGDDPGSCGSN